MSKDGNSRSPGSGPGAGMKRKSNLRRASVFVIGFIGTLTTAAFFVGPTFSATFFDKKDVVRYEAFDPQNADAHKFAIISNCILGHYSSYNNPETGRVKLDGFAILGKVLNRIVDDSAAGQNQRSTRFFDFSRTNGELRDFTFYLRHVLRLQNVKAVIMANDFGGLNHVQTSDLASTLEAIEVMEEFRREFPRLSDRFDRYKKSLVDTEEYVDAERVYGREWRRLMDPVTRALPRYSIEGRSSTLYDGTEETAASIRRRVYWLSWLERLDLPNVFRRIADARDQLVYATTPLLAVSQERERQEFNRAVSIVEERYDAEIHEAAPVVQLGRHPYFEGPSGSIFDNWLHLVAAVLKERGIRFIYYFPPNLSIAEKDYREWYKPKYIDPVRERLESYGHVVIDRTLDARMNSSDIVTKNYAIGDEEGLAYKVGRDTNIVGNIKRAVFLLEDLVRLGLIENDVLRNPWGERVEKWKTDRPLNLVPGTVIADRYKQRTKDRWLQLLTSPQLTSMEPLGGVDRYFDENVWPLYRRQQSDMLDGMTAHQYKCNRALYNCEDRSGRRVFQRVRYD